MKSSGFSIAVNSVLVGSMCGNIADTLRNVKTPEKTVQPKAIKAVINNSFPAPLPRSPIAGVTSPNMIRGMENDRKLPNNELKVTKIRAIPPGKNWPNNTPAAIAITTLVNNDTLIFFMVLLYFEANGGHRQGRYA